METPAVPNSGPAFFDNQSLIWDEKVHVQKWAIQATETILSCVDIKDTMDVLDFGSGTGILSFLLLDRVRVNSILGLDSSPGMIKVFERKIESKGSNNVKAIHMELHNPSQLLGYGKSGLGKFDLIISHLAFHHIADIPGMTKILADCLADNGILIITDYEVCDYSIRFHRPSAGEFVEHPWGLNREEMKRAFEDAGLIDVSAKYAFSGRKGVELEEGEVVGQGILDTEGWTQFPFIIVIGHKNA